MNKFKRNKSALQAKMRIFGKYRDKQSKKRRIFDNASKLLDNLLDMANNISGNLLQLYRGATPWVWKENVN